jgi:hypothetical protein
MITTATTPAMKPTIIKTNRRISFCKIVSSVLGLFVKLAILPKTVLSPVATHMPMAVPEMQ